MATFTREDIMDLTIIKVGEKRYLGVLKETEKGVVLEDAQTFLKGSDDATFKAWLKKKNLGELAAMELRGAVAYVKKSLTVDQAEAFRRLQVDFDRAKEMAIPLLENSTFDQRVK